MGREIKRVPLDFNWPLSMIWKGYFCPYRSQECKACEGSGYSHETKKLSDDWYDFRGTGRRWAGAITQDEVQALLDAGRLTEYTHHVVSGKGWVKDPTARTPTAEEINARYNRPGPTGGVFLHDAINRSICVETRAKRLGVWGDCPLCNGYGRIWHSDAVRLLAENWDDDERYDPPKGDGWQVWETVSEGSPVSPVFVTPEACIDWLASKGYAREAAEKFVRKDQWCLTATMVNGQLLVGIDSCTK